MSLYELLRAGKVAAFNAARPARSTLDLFAADLANLNLRGVNLTGANLEKADLSGTDLTDADLTRATLSGADFTEATLDNCNAARAKLKEAFLGDARAVGANFTGADLAEADLTGINAQAANFTGARMKEAVLQNAHLVRANLTEARLADADLRGAEMEHSTLVDAELPGANLSGAHLQGANLRGARMARAALRQTDLTGAVLRDADLSGADLTGAITLNADFSNADLFDAQVDPDLAKLAQRPPAEPRVELFVEEPDVAANATHVAVLWENADGEDVLTLRYAVFAKGVRWDGRALAVGVSGEHVIARALSPQSTGFVALFFVDRGGQAGVVPVRIANDGSVAVGEQLRLGFQPAVTPIVRAEGDKLFIYGLTAQGKLIVNELVGTTLVERLAAPAASWRGFCSRHHPVLLGKGGVVSELRPDGMGPLNQAPPGFPGRLQAVCPQAGEGLVYAWTRKDDPGLNVDFGAGPAVLDEEADMAGVDLLQISGATHLLWIVEADENEPFVQTGAAKAVRLRAQVRVNDIEDARFAASSGGPVVQLSTASGACVVVEIAGDRVLELGTIAG